MGGELERFNIGLGVVLLLMFIFLLYCNIIQDQKDKETLDKIICHKEVKLPRIRNIDVLVIESVVEGYWKKKYMNKSNCAKIWGDIKTGVVRGALGGAIVGGGWSGVTSGAIVFGALSGLSKAYHLTYSKSSFLNPLKHT